MAYGPSPGDNLIQRLMECAVCLSKVRNHRALPCQHIFCEDCLVPLVHNNRLPCPVCRDDRAVLGIAGVPSLPRSVLLMQCLEKYCVQCLDRNKDILCQHCNRWLCVECHKSCEIMQELVTSTADRLSVHSEALQNMEEAKVNLSQNLARLSKDITEHAEELAIKMSEQIKGEMLKDLREKVGREASRLDDVSEGISSVMRRYESFVTEARPTKLECVNPSDIHDLCEIWKQHLCDDLASRSILPRQFDFIPDSKFILDSNSSCGSIDVIIPVDYKSGSLSVREVGGFGRGPGQFDSPVRAMVSQMTGNIFVTEQNSNRVQIFSGHGEFLYELGSGFDTIDLSNTFLPLAHSSGPSPGRGVAVDSRGHVVVYDSIHHTFTRFGDGDEYTDVMDHRINIHTWVDYPCGIAVNKDQVYVCDGKHMRILVLDREFRLLRHFATKGLAPEDLAFSPTEELFVVGHDLDLTGELRGYSSDGTHKYTLGTGRHGSARLVWPLGVTVTKDGHVIVADGYTNEIHIFNGRKRLIRTLGTMGCKPGEFNQPTGVACTLDGRIVVVDSANHRLQIISFV